MRTFTRNLFKDNLLARFATSAINLMKIFALLVWTSITWSGAWRVHPEGRISEEGGGKSVILRQARVYPMRNVRCGGEGAGSVALPNLSLHD